MTVLAAFRASYWSFIYSLGFTFALAVPQDDDLAERLELAECELAATRHELAELRAQDDRALDALLLGVLAPLDAWLAVNGPRVTLRAPDPDHPFAAGPLRDGAPFHFTLRLDDEAGDVVAAWHFRLTDADRGKVRGNAGNPGEPGSYDYEVDEDDEEYAWRVRNGVAAQVRAFARAADADQLDALRAARAHLYHRPTHDAPPERLNRTLRIY